MLSSLLTFAMCHPAHIHNLLHSVDVRWLSPSESAAGTATAVSAAKFETLGLLGGEIDRSRSVSSSVSEGGLNITVGNGVDPG